MQQGFRTAFFLLLLTFFLLPESQAQPSNFSVTHYTNENGLAQNSVKAIELDEHGFLWIVTEAGLVRFDGQHFHLVDKEDYPALASRYVSPSGFTVDNRILFADGQSRLFALNKYNQLVRVKRSIAPWLLVHENNYESYTPAEKKEVNDMNIWVSEYRSDENYLIPLKVKGAPRGFVCLNTLELLYISGRHVVWRMPLEYYRSAVNKYAGRLGENFYYIDSAFTIKQVDQYGTINTVVLKGIKSELKVKENNGYTHGLFQQEERLYLQDGKGIYELKVSGAHELTAQLMLETDIPSISAYRNYPEYNLQVIGTQTQGLYLFHKKQYKSFTFKNGLGNFYPQALYKDSGVLTTLGVIFPHSSQPDYPFEMQQNRSILLDGRGHYWVNKTDFYLREYSAHITELDENLRTVRTLRNLYGIDCYRETPDSSVWMSAFQGHLLGKLSGDSIAWLKKVWPMGTIITFLPKNNVEFWVGGTNAFMKLNVYTGKEKHYKHLEQFTIETLYLDKNEVLWIGTRGNGFFALKNDRIFSLPTDSKGSLSNVHTFMEDKSGFMWMTTNNGLFRCKKKDMDNFVAGKTTGIYYQCFKKESGFNTNEFNGSCTPSGIILKDGKFSLPSIDGLVQFYPDSIKEALPTNGIFVDKLLVDGKQQFLTGNTIHIDPSFKFLEVQISSPYFGNPVNQLLEYRLAGLDNAWHPVSENNTVVFNNLAHGNYTLQFRKRAGFGYNNVIMTSIPISVNPFFYQTIYFKVAVLFIAGLLVFATVKLRYAYLVRRNKELEDEVSQRTVRLLNANRLKEKMLMMVGHDLQSPLHFMSLLSGHVDDALDQRQIEKARTGNNEVKSAALKIHAFVEEFNLWARLQDENFNLTKRVFSLSEMITELSGFFKEMFSQHNNHFEFKTDNEAYELYANRELLKAILRNLLDNANKHTRDGCITIQCYSNDRDKLTIKVSDTGKGMSAVELNNIKRRIEKQEDAFLVSNTSKLGYQLIIDFVTSLHARLWIESKKDEGTEVIISELPLYRKEANLLAGKTESGSELY